MRKVINILHKTSVKFKGPTPFPAHIDKFRVINNGGKQLKICLRKKLKIYSHRRFLEIIDPTQETIDVLKNFDMPTGAIIEIKHD
ncbi:MAG: hypothetical protein HY883_06640 [Deltaproteobacteria bacterium]|nr:hypothetical protein [Deltaproteobacteria bacterium]